MCVYMRVHSLSQNVRIYTYTHVKRETERETERQLHTYMHAYIHTYTHTYMYTCAQAILPQHAAPNHTLSQPFHSLHTLSQPFHSLHTLSQPFHSLSPKCTSHLSDLLATRDCRENLLTVRTVYLDFFEGSLSAPNSDVDCSRVEQKCWKLDDVDACERQYTVIESTLASVDVVQKSLHP
jgi:hypothetical protein